MAETPSHGARRSTRGRQLLRRDLPAVLGVVGRGGRARRDAGAAIAARIPAIPLGLYLHIPFCRKRCHFCYFRVYTDKNAQESRPLPRRARARVGAVRAAAGDCGTAAELRLLRRRHAVVPLDAAAAGAGVADLTAVTPWNRRRRDHLRVRARHADRAQAEGDPEDGRHASEPGRRELRRPHPRDQRPRAPLAGDRPGLPLRARRSGFRRSTST